MGDVHRAVRNGRHVSRQSTGGREGEGRSGGGVGMPIALWL